MNRTRLGKNNNGFTIIETLIYTGLFTILIGGVGSSVYSIAESSARNSTKALLQTDGDFLVGKINWALSGIKLVNEPAVGLTSNKLSVTKWDSGIGVVVVTTTGTDMTLSRGGSPALLLSNTDTTVSDLSFIHQFSGGTNPESVEVSFTLTARTPNGMTIEQKFKTKNYLRK